MSRLMTRTDLGYTAAAPSEKVMRYELQGYAPAGGKPVLLYQHSSGEESADEPVNIFSGDLNAIALFRTLVGDGWLILSADDAFDNWGNDTVITDRLPSKLTYARANGGWSRKAVLMGTSMGLLPSLNYARANPGNVAGIVGLLGLCDLQDAWHNATFTARVNTAYGGTYNDATMGATHNPADYGASLAGIPVLLLADQDDTTTIKWSTVTALATLIGSSCTVLSGHWGGTHGSSSEWAGVAGYLPQIRQFLDTCRAAA